MNKRMKEGYDLKTGKVVREEEDVPENWDQNDRHYAQAIVNTTKEFGDNWTEFAGQALVAGIALDISIKDIMSYVIESYHGMSYANEIPKGYDAVYEDMKMYKSALPE